jgi:hypothetical protein
MGLWSSEDLSRASRWASSTAPSCGCGQEALVPHHMGLSVALLRCPQEEASGSFMT